MTTTDQVSGLARRARTLAERVLPPARRAADLALAALLFAPKRRARMTMPDARIDEEE